MGVSIYLQVDIVGLAGFGSRIDAISVAPGAQEQRPELAVAVRYGKPNPIADAGSVFAVQLRQRLVGKYLQLPAEWPWRLHKLDHRHHDNLFPRIYPEGRSRGTPPAVPPYRAYDSGLRNVGDDTKSEPKPASTGHLAAGPWLKGCRQVVHSHELYGLGRQDAYALKLAAGAEHLR